METIKWLSGDQEAKGTVLKSVCDGKYLKVIEYDFEDDAFSSTSEAQYAKAHFTDVLVGFCNDQSELEGIKPGDKISFEIHRSADQHARTLWARIIPEAIGSFTSEAETAVDGYVDESLKKVVSLLTDVLKYRGAA